MRRTVCAAATMIASLVVFGCDTKGEKKEAAGESGGVQEARGAANAAPSGRLFDKALTKKACDILTADHVGRTFGVPAAELKQMRVMGCVYTWKAKEEKDGNEKMQLEARFTTISVHESEDAAKLWFANSTKGMSEAEAKQAMDAVVRRAKEREEIDTEAKEKALDDVGSAIGELTGSEGIRFESASGVGDEARFNLSDGGLWVRVGNLTFVVAAYHGPSQPRPDFKGVGMKEIAKLAIQSNKEWIQKTMPKRKANALELASVVVKALP